jgi:hypothetical protein
MSCIEVAPPQLAILLKSLGSDEKIDSPIGLNNGLRFPDYIKNI